MDLQEYIFRLRDLKSDTYAHVKVHVKVINKVFLESFSNKYKLSFTVNDDSNHSMLCLAYEEDALFFDSIFSDDCYYNIEDFQIKKVRELLGHQERNGDELCILLTQRSIVNLIGCPTDIKMINIRQIFQISQSEPLIIGIK